ncbi:hypothetical protein [Chryseobacterium chendengshani]|uniref:hypothetical protein n=1 Tax=Chryseobacterium sp. LJ756 TaxID=2864113 RepID=UPI001C64041C|nr:hypothetical protein [Chryseobacterium sp. LJ756]MBW7675747.1 hypothetical protein [Chryseobacterium sp. LJ756]
MDKDIKTILLITYDNWGFNQYIADALEAKGHEVKHINFHHFRYKYPNLGYKIFNFFTKNTGILNLKHQHYNSVILKEIEKLNKIDTSIYIKADFLSPETIKAINKKSEKSVLIISDSINRYPKTKKILTLFDKVFSFEKKDCEKYNLIFKTNFIYNYVEHIPEVFKYKVFNISSLDNRFPVFQKIAKYLHQLNINYRIIIFTSKKENDPYLEFSKTTLSISENNALLAESEIMLDVHRTQQQGLSFRVFESLGLHKKLITTNSDIINYDFYNPENIHIIEDVEKISIPELFFEKPYTKVPKKFLEKYLIENWVEELI